MVKMMCNLNLVAIKTCIKEKMKSYEYWGKEFNYNNKSVSTAYQAGVYDGLKYAMQFIEDCIEE